jgi:hypothetical protein
MKIVPLSKEIVEECKENKVECVKLEFTGGSDEGYLNVDMLPWKENLESLCKKIEEWAWQHYEYSGAGCGGDYGDDISYNIADNSAMHEYWQTERSYQDHGTTYFN